jgi:hypothetical protein
MTKKELHKKFLHKCKEHRIFVLKISGSTKYGFADFCVIRWGKVHFIKFRNKGKKKTPLQVAFQNYCKLNNFKYIIIDDIDNFDFSLLLDCYKVIYCE